MLSVDALLSLFGLDIGFGTSERVYSECTSVWARTQEVWLLSKSLSLIGTLLIV